MGFGVFLLECPGSGLGLLNDVCEGRDEVGRNVSWWCGEAEMRPVEAIFSSSRKSSVWAP